MNEGNWQNYLGAIWERLGSQEKDDLAKAVGVTRTSFIRWIYGETIPKASNVEALVSHPQLNIERRSLSY